ncbi:MAG TPA: polysaccharide deacetylase family protein [Terriglobales bacterium]|nr:polysaccharide deacetylase family protein [Terriglobales bacterium]
MSLRSQARTSYIRAAAALGLDELALFLNSKRRQAAWGVVVEVHDTPPALAGQFRSQLEWVAEHFRIVNLETFAELWSAPAAAQREGKPWALFTFDDGRESNYEVGAPLLESFGARGVFFVVPAFVECPQDEAFTFYRSNVNPESKVGDELHEDWKPMNPGQIRDLAARGHAIGNHTLSHARLLGLSRENLEREIGESARKIAAWTDKAVDAFAWTFSWDSVDPAAWEVIRRYHRFCFTPCAGAVDGTTDQPSLIWRREIEVRYSPAEFRFFYSGLGDFAWASRRRKLRKLLGVNGG